MYIQAKQVDRECSSNEFILGGISMLNLLYTRQKAPDITKAYQDCRYFFSKNKKAEWFKDPFVQTVMKGIDGTTLIDGFVLKNGDGDVIPPEYLPTGTKAVICTYEFPDLIFNGTQMGYNAFKFIQELCKKQDRTVLMYKYMPEQLLEGLVLQKDYKPFNLADYDDLVDDWLEESRQD